jgi:hypothetical protein
MTLAAPAKMSPEMRGQLRVDETGKADLLAI